MKTADLELSKKERKEYNTISTPIEGPRYPYCTTIELEKDALKELGLTPETLPKSGTEITIEAKGYIKRTQVESKENDKDSMCLTIQVTEIGFEPTKKQKKEITKSRHLSEIA